MNAAAKVGVSVIVLVLAIPGLIIEPGPVSELAAIGILGTIWGVETGAEE